MSPHSALQKATLVQSLVIVLKTYFEEINLTVRSTLGAYQICYVGRGPHSFYFYLLAEGGISFCKISNAPARYASGAFQLMAISLEA